MHDQMGRRVRTKSFRVMGGDVKFRLGIQGFLVQQTNSADVQRQSFLDSGPQTSDPSQPQFRKKIEVSL